MADYPHIDRSLQGVLKVAQRLEAALNFARREKEIRAGYIQGMRAAAVLAEEHSQKLNQRFDNGEITGDEFKLLRTECGQLIQQFQQHALQHVENDKQQVGRIAGLEHALEMVAKVGDQEMAAIEAYKKVPSAVEQLEQQEGLQEHLRKAREASQAKAEGNVIQMPARHVEQDIRVSEEEFQELLKRNSKKALVEKAKKAGISITGTKAEIARRILIATSKGA